MPTPSPLLRAGLRLRASWRTFAQAAIAIGGSWLVATVVLGYTAPFFAPIAAVIVLNSPARRGRRALEIVVGVAVGIAIADLFVLAIGTGWWQLALVSVLAMSVVTAAGGGPLIVTQATVAAILVVTLQPPTVDLIPHRFIHAVIGGTVALAATSLLPVAPDRQLGRAAAPVIHALVRTLAEVADALHRGDEGAAVQALEHARALDQQVAQLRESVEVAHETARLAPLRRGHRGLVDVYADAVGQLDLAVRNTRVLGRAVVALLQQDAGEPPPPELGDAVLDLADAVRALGAQLVEGAPADATRRYASAAAARTRPLYADGRALATSRVVGQIRSAGIDLLRGSGLDLDDAQRTLYDAPDPDPRT
jgi:uncharacterized membrane protein YgaE (UPF0421/DUF939 family)